MIKRFSKYIFLFLTLALVACDDYLDKLPDNRATLSSPKAVRELLVSAYPLASYQLFTETMSDNVSDRGPQANDLDIFSPSSLIAKKAYYWENLDGDQQETPTAYWSETYKAIGTCNQALEAIKNNGGGPEYNPMKGEALVARAYLHFMLVNIFAEHYDPTTAETALGIPFVTEPEKVVFKNYTRNTVKEVYDRIVEDFTAGFALIDDTQYPVSSARTYHFTTKAAAAFASRLYLYLNKPDSVIKYSSIVLGPTPATVLRDYVGVYDKLSSAEAKAAQYNKGDDPANVLLIANISWLMRARYNRYATPYSMLQTEALKTNVTGARNSYSFYGWSQFNGIFAPKFMEYFKRDGINANYGLGYVMVPAFTTDEALLNRAEASVMKSDFVSALSDINAFYSTRVAGFYANNWQVTHTKVLDYTLNMKAELKPFYSISNEQMPYIRVLLDARKMEFIHEGLRWFDIKRMHIPVVHSFYNNEFPALTLTANDPRREVQLPLDAITFGLVPNPRDVAPASTLIKE